MSETKTYRVSGASKVFGVEPGETFEREIPPEQEAQLLAGGAIELVYGNPVDVDPEPEPEEDKEYVPFWRDSATTHKDKE